MLSPRRYEPFKEDLRPGHVEIVEGSAQAERVLGGEGGCWVSWSGTFELERLLPMPQ